MRLFWISILVVALLFGCISEQSPASSSQQPAPPDTSAQQPGTASSAPAMPTGNGLAISSEKPSSTGEPSGTAEGSKCYDGAKSIDEMRVCASIRDSASLWIGGVKPYAVIGHRFSSGGDARIIVQNMDASGSSTITGLDIAGYSGKTNVAVQPGEKIALAVTGTPKCKSGELYSYPLKISYLSSSGEAQTETGGKPLVGKCA